MSGAGYHVDITRKDVVDLLRAHDLILTTLKRIVDELPGTQRMLNDLCQEAKSLITKAEGSVP